MNNIQVKRLENSGDMFDLRRGGGGDVRQRVGVIHRPVAVMGERVIGQQPDSGEVRKAGEPVELTYKEFELLKLLCTRRGVALTRDEILQAVWDYDYTGETRTVDMHVKALRQKLGEDVITTVRGVGYKMS